jgi:predicted nucleic acid-binding protein
LILFLDTSALVKLYIAETGSDRMLEAAQAGDPIAVSVLAFAEIQAAFARRRREELLLAREQEELQQRFTREWGELAHVPLTAQTLSLIPKLCERHPLRGADAVHLASAVLLHQQGLEVTFACSDQRLLAAAASEGLETFDPQQEA